MARKTIFLEMAFWDKFLECCPVLSPHMEGGNPMTVMEKSEKWYNLYKFICRSSVFVDRPLAELAEKAKTQNDGFLRFILKRSSDGEMGLEESIDPFPNLESDEEFKYDSNYSSLILSAENHNQGARRHGVINISIDTIWEQNDKFRDTGEPVTAGKGFAWSKMNLLRENSNGMVIVDNFILSPNRKTERCEAKYDVKELLRLMLPVSYKEEYVVSIFYSDDSDSAAVREERKDQFYQSLMKFIKPKKKGLNIILELFPTLPNGKTFHKDFHDRTIITNNVWIGSEAGFDLLVKDLTTNTNTRALKTTKTHGLYLGFGSEVANWLDKSYDDLIREAKQCLTKYGYTTENRLLL